MFKIAKPLFLICETPLHVGSGDDLGIVDLPIQRERHTGFPKVESSSLKGSLRSTFEQAASKDKDKMDFLIKIHTAFGYDEAGISEPIKEVFKDKDGKEATEFAGCLGFSDARLLLFPVKSMKGVFAWITCPRVLNKFQTDMALCDVKFDFKMPNEKQVPENTDLFIDHKKEKIVLEEYAFDKIQENETCTKLANYLSDKLFDTQQSYWKNKIKQDIVVLTDDDFTDFVNLSTEVITRTKINNETGTVEPGALFTEEFLPTDSIMYSLILASPEFGNKKEKSFDNEKEVINCFDTSIQKIDYFFQLGGDATLGKGIVRAVFLNENPTDNNAKKDSNGENHCPIKDYSALNSYSNRYMK